MPPISTPLLDATASKPTPTPPDRNRSAHARRTPFATALTELEQRDEFIGRHIGPDEHEIAAMLASIGVDSASTTLIDQTVPAAIRLQARRCRCPRRAANTRRWPPEGHRGKNVVKKSLIGQGYYGTLTPP
jgi:glycine dehydrogenase